MLGDTLVFRLRADRRVGIIEGLFIVPGRLPRGSIR